MTWPLLRRILTAPGVSAQEANRCRLSEDFRKNTNGTWTSAPNTKIGDTAFPQHTFGIRGVSIGGADLATVLNRKCGGMPPVR
jgi:hypothetical protein